MIARTRNATYEHLYGEFAWSMPAAFNIAVACADRHPRDALALIELGRDDSQRTFTFGDMSDLSNRLANGLVSLGVGTGHRVGVILPQGVEAALAHLAIYKVGAIAVPMSRLFGAAALRHRFTDCEPRAVLTDRERFDEVTSIAVDLERCKVVCTGGVVSPHVGFWELIRSGSPRYLPATTGPDSPALLIYTSGTTGPPKGALHGHRVLLGHLPGFELSHDFFPRAEDLFWTPADWAWIGGLMDALLPSWYHGRPVVAAARTGFEPEWALSVLARTGVRNAFLPPTALKLIRQSGASPKGVRLRTLMCGGEVLGADLLEWAFERLGVSINEIYGQTEANYVVGNSANVWRVRPGSMGRAYPGHQVTVLGADDSVVTDGEVGEVAVRSPDPVLFLNYWGRPEATRERFTADGLWLRTGDLATRDDGGYFWFKARADDVINSAGHRIGPTEIEECLMRHPAVAMAAVIGVPDDTRGQAVKAFICLARPYEPSAELERDIRDLVRNVLAAYMYPRHVEFVLELPLTTTGKVQRAELRNYEVTRAQDGRHDVGG